MRPRIDGETQILGLLGRNISYTKSPAMHNRAIQSLGINAAYLPFDLESKDVLSFLDVALRMNVTGFNVTQPHKELVAEKYGDKKISSANTLVRKDGTWVASSTDGIGFEKSFQRVNRELASFEHLVFLGNGGAVTAILEHIASLSFSPSLSIVRRSSSRDAGLQSLQKKPISWLEWTPEALTEVLAGKDQKTLLIQASSAPLKGDDMSRFVPALKDYNGVVCDLVYSTPSKLYFAALNANLSALDGEAMLIEQARASQKIWWGKAASYEEMLQALRGK